MYGSNIHVTHRTTVGAILVEGKVSYGKIWGFADSILCFHLRKSFYFKVCAFVDFYIWFIISTLIVDFRKSVPSKK